MTIQEASPAPDLVAAHDVVARVNAQLRKVIVGQDQLLERLLLGLLCNGHVLIEGVPGLAKSLAVKTLADAIDAGFRRVQFTPDLLPADLNGTMVYNPSDQTFRPRLGPIFTNILLADEINRAPAKVQSALLEAMEERQVSIGGESHPLGDPFMVLATQNPIEHEGTYALAEAQLDRFMMKVIVGYPKQAEESVIVDRQTVDPPADVRPVATRESIAAARGAVRAIYLDGAIKDYILRVVFATREPERFGLAELRPLIAYGASPRASIFLSALSRAHAFLDGRDYVLPDDVKDLAPDVMRHRLIVTYEAQADEINAERIIRQVLDKVPVP